MSQPHYAIHPRPPVLAADFYLDSYIVHSHQQLCSNCGRRHHWCQVYEVHINPRLTGLTAAHQLKPAKALKGGFSIGYSMLQPETIPCCHDCFQDLKADSLPKPEMIPLDHDEWARTLKRKYATAPSAAEGGSAGTSSPKRQPTIDDL